VTELLLVRHAETDWNRDKRFQGHADPPLNARGREQAHALADSLAADPPTAIYASDLARAAETAAIVGARLEVPVVQEVGLREIDVGSWQGLTREEIDRRFPNGEWDGETYEAHRERVLEAVDRIAARHPGERVLVVAHGGTMRRVQEVVLGEAEPLFEHCGIWSAVVEDGILRPVH
jgi:broad specificity phosphatase PhoE